MAADEQKAISIASFFAQKMHNDARFRVLFESGKATFEQGGIGHDQFGLGENYWSVVFMLQCADPTVAVVCPDHIIVLVDLATEKAVWLPTM